ncbi:8345_t:CDS:2 [Cetraspora pellucida]|uniref:8345_t:CDS:1 n=1 Tax=Cetraspora pellucida TaxID=1433469 RepID=A0ACA9L821_9GLOM|nr:8345_t:CDS:2 [Cetraspora pellucida]
MYGNVGLSTPRGSGTNGYVVRNLSYIKTRRDNVQYESLDEIKSKSSSLLNRKPNKDILKHEKKRQIEIKCIDLRRQLEEDGQTEEEIEGRVNAFRNALLSAVDVIKDDKSIQEHQIHQLSQAKAVENEKMMKALGIKSNNYVEGASFDRELQAQKKLERATQREKEIEERQKRKELEERQKRKEVEERQKRKEVEERQRRKEVDERQKRKEVDERQKRKAERDQEIRDHEKKHRKRSKLKD